MPARENEETYPTERAATAAGVRLRCSKCLSVLPVSAFYPDSSKASGYKSQCRSCIGSARRAARSNESDEARSRRQDYRRAYMEAHRDEARDYARKWRLTHAEEVRQYRENWRRRRGITPRAPAECLERYRSRQSLQRNLRLKLQTMSGLKWCSRCNVPKPLSSFYRDKRRPDGLWSCCIPCFTASRYRDRAKCRTDNHASPSHGRVLIESAHLLCRANTALRIHARVLREEATRLITRSQALMARVTPALALGSGDDA